MNKLLRKQSDTAWEFFNPSCNVHCISKKPHAKRKTNLQTISNVYKDEVQFKEVAGTLNFFSRIHFHFFHFSTLFFLSRISCFDFLSWFLVFMLFPQVEVNIVKFCQINFLIHFSLAYVLYLAVYNMQMKIIMQQYNLKATYLILNLIYIIYNR